MGSSEYKKEIVKGEKANTTENQDFAKEARGTQSDIEYETDLESRERAKVGGVEKSLEIGKSRQGVVNEEKRQADVYPIDKQMAEQRANQLEAKSGMAAAAQEIQARQAQQQFLQSQMPRYGGGPATGKGGGGGPKSSMAAVRHRSAAPPLPK